MLTYTDHASLRAAARDPTLDPFVSAVLSQRFKQLGGDGANFHVVESGDRLTDAEAAVGYPLALDEAPCWEWTEPHPGGWTEVVFVLSDDGPVQVLLVPDDADPSITNLLRLHATPAVDRQTTETA